MDKLHQKINLTKQIAKIVRLNKCNDLESINLAIKLSVELHTVTKDCIFYFTKVFGTICENICLGGLNDNCAESNYVDSNIKAECTGKNITFFSELVSNLVLSEYVSSQYDKYGAFCEIVDSLNKCKFIKNILESPQLTSQTMDSQLTEQLTMISPKLYASLNFFKVIQTISPMPYNCVEIYLLSFWDKSFNEIEWLINAYALLWDSRYNYEIWQFEYSDILKDLLMILMHEGTIDNLTTYNFFKRAETIIEILEEKYKVYDQPLLGFSINIPFIAKIVSQTNKITNEFACKCVEIFINKFNEKFSYLKNVSARILVDEFVNEKLTKIMSLLLNIKYLKTVQNYFNIYDKLLDGLFSMSSYENPTLDDVYRTLTKLYCVPVEYIDKYFFALAPKENSELVINAFSEMWENKKRQIYGHECEDLLLVLNYFIKPSVSINESHGVDFVKCAIDVCIYSKNSYDRRKCVMNYLESKNVKITDVYHD